MKIEINKFSFVFILASIFLFSSCNSNLIYSDSHVMTDKTWELFDSPVFNVPISDTTNINDVSFVIRTGSSYPYRNIFLFVTAYSPDGKSITDTIQYYLADEKGKWYGKGIGDIHELLLPYKSNVYFPAKGIYKFKIQHGMRDEDLKGVYDVGLKVENVSK